jgi:hypothetical protein
MLLSMLLASLRFYLELFLEKSFALRVKEMALKEKE